MPALFPLDAEAAEVAKAGAAYVVSPSGKPLPVGGSATEFTLRLPVGAACPGDSYHHGYLVYSYGIPTSVEPSTLTFPGTFPSSGVDLITTGGVPFVAQSTAVRTAAIETLPSFAWSRYDHDPTDFPLGQYHVGIACAHVEGKVVSYWNTNIDFVQSTSDPGGFTWHVVGPTADPPAHGSPQLIPTVVVVLLLIGAGSGIALRIRRLRTARSG